MKYSYYDLFSEENREPDAENVRNLTMHRIAPQHTQRASRPMRTVLIAAVLALALIGGAFAAPAIWNALRGLGGVQTGKSAVLLSEDRVMWREGCVEITPDVEVNPEAPEEIEQYYLPTLCARWTPKTLYYTSDEAPRMKNSAFFAWTLPGDDYVIFEQYPLAGYRGDRCFDTVPLGFGSDYALGELDCGGLTVSCITVPPSASDERVNLLDGAEAYLPAGVRGYDPERPLHDNFNGVQFDADEDGTASMYYRGLRRLYWSDGDYLFVLEVNYGMEEAQLAQIVASVAAVPDVSPYVKLEHLPLDMDENPDVVAVPLFPTAVPEGWTLTGEGGLTDENRNCTWIWYDGEMSAIQLLQTSFVESYRLEQMDWLGSMEDIERGESEVLGCPAESFESSNKVSLFWQSGTDYFILSSEGPNRLSLDELHAFAQSLAPLP